MHFARTAGTVSHLSRSSREQDKQNKILRGTVSHLSCSWPSCSIQVQQAAPACRSVRRPIESSSLDWGGHRRRGTVTVSLATNDEEDGRTSGGARVKMWTSGQVGSKTSET